jgi:putative exosortase-associated protein (TIGR04073 family)
MIHSRKTVVAGIFLLTVLFTQASFAEISCLGEPESSVKLASVKLWRGIVNTATGWGELIRQPIVMTAEDGLVGIPTGIINGIFMTFVRTGAGIIEVVTFPLPLEYEGGYDSIMNPDYVWQCVHCVPCAD